MLAALVGLVRRLGKPNGLGLDTVPRKSLFTDSVAVVVGVVSVLVETVFCEERFSKICCLLTPNVFLALVVSVSVSEFVVVVVVGGVVVVVILVRVLYKVLFLCLLTKFTSSSRSVSSVFVKLSLSLIAVLVLVDSVVVVN